MKFLRLIIVILITVMLSIMLKPSYRLCPSILQSVSVWQYAHSFLRQTLLFRRLISIHMRHLNVHQNQIVISSSKSIFGSDYCARIPTTCTKPALYIPPVLEMTDLLPCTLPAYHHAMPLPPLIAYAQAPA